MISPAISRSLRERASGVEPIRYESSCDARPWAAAWSARIAGRVSPGSASERSWKKVIQAVKEGSASPFSRVWRTISRESGRSAMSQ